MWLHVVACVASWRDQARPGQRVTGELIFALAAYSVLSCHLPHSINFPITHGGGQTFSITSLVYR